MLTRSRCWTSRATPWAACALRHRQPAVTTYLDVSLRRFDTVYPQTPPPSGSVAESWTSCPTAPDGLMWQNWADWTCHTMTFARRGIAGHKGGFLCGIFHNMKQQLRPRCLHHIRPVLLIGRRQRHRVLLYLRRHPVCVVTIVNFSFRAWQGNCSALPRYRRCSPGPAVPARPVIVSVCP